MKISIYFGVLLFFISPFIVFSQNTPLIPPEIFSSLDPKTQEQLLEAIERSSPEAQIESHLETFIIPSSPKPNEGVEISVVSYLTDLSRAKIFWYVNDRLISSGIGISSFSFTVGSSGSSSVVNVVIETEEGFSVSKKFSFSPMDVDILWEADTYVPPFYKGKALLTAESKLKLVAFPNFVLQNGATIKPSSLIYTWRRENKIIQSPQYGQSTISVDATIPFGNNDIEVEVSSFNGAFSSKNTVSIDLHTSEVILYEEKPIQGILYNSSLIENFALVDTEISVRAEPYYFSKRGLSYVWTINNEPASTEDTLTLRNEAGVSGQSKIEILIRNTLHTFQHASNALLISFIESATTDGSNNPIF